MSPILRAGATASCLLGLALGAPASAQRGAGVGADLVESSAAGAAAGAATGSYGSRGRGDRDASPIIPEALSALCYYDGITYSPGAVIGTELASAASQRVDARLLEDRRTLECVWSGEAGVPAFWAPLDPEARRR